MTRQASCNSYSPLPANIRRGYGGRFYGPTLNPPAQKNMPDESQFPPTMHLFQTNIRSEGFFSCQVLTSSPPHCWQTASDTPPNSRATTILGWTEGSVDNIIRRYVDRSAATRAVILQLNKATKHEPRL